MEIEAKIYALVASREAGLKIIDFSDPKKPVLAGIITSYQCIDFHFYLYRAYANSISTCTYITF